MSKFCDKCGHELKNDNARFCDNCGAELKLTQNQSTGQTSVSGIICPHCGQTTPMGHMNCINCGAPIQTEDNSLAVVAGYIVTALFTLLGIIPAIYLLTRENAKAKTQGLWLLITAIVGAVCNILFGVLSIVIIIALLIAGMILWFTDTTLLN